jgi:steroid 5-alpha reductase family enzyme
MFLSSFLQSAFLIFICLNVLFLLAFSIRNNSIIDIFWGPGFLIICLFTLFQADSFTPKKILVLCLVAIWSVRLSGHIFIRNKGRGEDFRYLNWRQQWKHFLLRSYFQIFILQGILMLVIASPLILINSSGSEHIGVLEILGFILFLSGFLYETIADYQLAKFRTQENAGKLMTSGLWRFSRHPNYFGEATLWWGIWLMAIPEVNGLFTMLSPLVITFLLRYVSGVPLLEKKYEGRQDWDAYKSAVPTFIPRFRK